MSQLIEVRASGLSGDDAFVAQVPVSVGQKVAQSATLVAIELVKAAVEIIAPGAGRVAQVLVAVNDAVKEGDLLMVLELNESEQPAEPLTMPKAESGRPAANAPPASGVGVAPKQEIHASPWIRGLARERGLDLSQIVATGRHGRIVEEDLVRPARTALEQPSANGSRAPARLDSAFSVPVPTESRPLPPLQRAVGRAVTQTWTRVPHVTQFEEADITELEAFRVALNQERERDALKFSLLPFVVKATACALAAFPDFNSALVEDQLQFRGSIHIGVAVDTAEGLRVPVIQHADRLTVRQIGREIARLADKARASKLLPTEVQGGSFTISNLGGAGGTAFTPIINAPELAILGLSKAAIKPVWNGSAFVPRLMLPLSLSYDHRVINGVAGARFVSHLGTVLSDLRRALL